MKEMPLSYHRILNRLEKGERRFLNRKPIPMPTAGLEEKIPPKVRATLEGAFERAFRLLFGPGGTKLVEKTYPKAKLTRAGEFWSGQTTPGEERRTLGRMDRRAFLDRSLGSVAAGAEGTLLGLLGVGLPDIPIMLAILLRSLYQEAGRYGFAHSGPAEQTYLLLVLQSALIAGEEGRELSGRADALGRALDHGWPLEYDLEGEITAASKALADRLLTVKFLQGFPLVGALGGVANLPLSGTVAKWGAIKYKKRFLERKMRGL